jgi:hypothetical protein
MFQGVVDTVSSMVEGVYSLQIQIGELNDEVSTLTSTNQVLQNEVDGHISNVTDLSSQISNL